MLSSLVGATLIASIILKDQVPTSKTLTPSNHRMLENEKTGPKGVAWLMGFPNSGTMFTTDVVTLTAHVATGTNYGNECLKQFGRGFHLKPEFAVTPMGPYKSTPHKMPEGYLLTKTHCHGYCMECSPEKYMVTLDNFVSVCRAGVRPKTDQELANKDDLRPNLGVQYDYDIVKKAILLIRNPFDNIVANFRYAHGKNRQHGNTEWQYSRDRDGFIKWCKDLDEQFGDDEDRLFSPLIKASGRDVPCSGQFYQYIHWHNNAVEATKKLGIPRLDIHYIDYHLDIEKMQKEVIEFLELSAHNSTQIPFRWNGGYMDYYTVPERIAIAIFIRYASSDELYKLLSRYLDEQVLLDEGS